MEGWLWATCLEWLSQDGLCIIRAQGVTECCDWHTHFMDEFPEARWEYLSNCSCLRIELAFWSTNQFGKGVKLTVEFLTYQQEGSKSLWAIGTVEQKCLSWICSLGSTGWYIKTSFCYSSWIIMLNFNVLIMRAFFNWWINDVIFL